MPNIQTKELKLHKFPFESDEYLFEFIAKGIDSNESLIFTRYKEFSFFLILIQRKNDYLIKADKLSRVSPISVVQNALKAFSKAHNLVLTYSNIDPKREYSVQRSGEYLKDISYFVDELKYDNEIWVEIGFGSGRHLLYQAKKHPQKQFIGLEIHSPSVEQVIKQCELLDIKNILICKFDARLFLEILNSNSVGKIFVHFPVPWDKKPHRRVISKKFIDESIRVLKKGGTLELRSDSDNYFNYSYELFISLSSVDLRIRKNQDIEISSKYEDRWRRFDKNIYDIIMTNSINSLNNEPFKPLDFDKWVEFSIFKSKFHKKSMVEDDFFVHFEEIYPIDDKYGVVKLSFGSFDRCEHKYMIFNNNKIEYFPNESLPIKENLKSHKKIKEFIYG